ncbi:hypothetical protein BT63DRAFT_468110 [Microthyrium microscopicum]|uniref:Cryptic loci regulator 2 N-terminal domain-containing protein n=1 Tax=Microthyrium microscopicum TaxID=703497 RepID=A0A6A6UK20_9PEZI|nr:hypothetical protein BT63DRAFT_468110 [Microthyrium microscopicum]
MGGMIKFQILNVLRSDGKAVVKGQPNKPSDSQQQIVEKKDKYGKVVTEYYRQLTRDDAKYMDWLQKLGCMLVSHLMPQQWDKVSKDSTLSYLLEDFPQHYTLWDHVKKVGQGEGSASKIRHDAGGHDRADAYLYGHAGKRRFRSPAEFFPHLLWLSTDTTQDTDNCSCRLCSPDILQPESPVVSRPRKKTTLAKDTPKPVKPKPKAAKDVPKPSPKLVQIPQVVIHQKPAKSSAQTPPMLAASTPIFAIERPASTPIHSQGHPVQTAIASRPASTTAMHHQQPMSFGSTAQHPIMIHDAPQPQQQHQIPQQQHQLPQQQQRQQDHPQLHHQMHPQHIQHPQAHTPQPQSHPQPRPQSHPQMSPPQQHQMPQQYDQQSVQHNMAQHQQIDPNLMNYYSNDMLQFGQPHQQFGLVNSAQQYSTYNMPQSYQHGLPQQDLGYVPEPQNTDDAEDIAKAAEAIDQAEEDTNEPLGTMDSIDNEILSFLDVLEQDMGLSGGSVANEVGNLEAAATHDATSRPLDTNSDLPALDDDDWAQAGNDPEYWLRQLNEAADLDSPQSWRPPSSNDEDKS